MSSLRPASDVSQITGASAALTTATRSCGSICPVPKLAWRSAPEPAASLESLQCTRSMRPVNALIRSTASISSSPAAHAWQVSGEEAEANAGAADVVPQPADGVEVAGHRVVPTRGVFQVHLHVGFQIVQ